MVKREIEATESGRSINWSMSYMGYPLMKSRSLKGRNSQACDYTTWRRRFSGTRISTRISRETR